jgi:putative exporter of polyketide antibiotics
MVASFASSLPLFLLVGLAMIVIAICYALRNKGDVYAELTHGKTTFKIDAKNKPPEKETQA